MVIAPTNRNEADVPQSEAMASFRFVGRDIDPTVITQRLKIQPSATYPPPDGESAVGHRRPANMWRLDSGVPQRAPLAEHLTALIKALSPVRQDLHDLTKETGWSPSFYCAFYLDGDQGGRIELPPRILAAIAALEATLDLRVYSDQDE